MENLTAYQLYHCKEKKKVYLEFKKEAAILTFILYIYSGIVTGRIEREKIIGLKLKQVYRFQQKIIHYE